MKRWLRAIVVSQLLVCLPACDKSPTGPTPRPPAAPVPSPVEPVITGVEIVGPREVAPGETVQFSLVARLTDGASRNVTNEANWSPGWGQEVSIAAPGAVTGRARGHTYIEARFDRHYANRLVIVVPAGTYRLQGRVAEPDGPTVGVAGARVEVTTGAGAGLFTFTDWWGGYWLYGVSGETSLRVTREGYQSATPTVVVADHLTFNVELPLIVPRADVSGIYTLTITAADHCRVGPGEGDLPEEIRVRTYTAAVRQEGPGLVVTLSGARFVAGDAQIVGRVEPGRLVFDFNWYDGEGPYVVEQLTDSRLLVLDGIVVAAGPANRHAGTLSGTFRIFGAGGVWTTPIAGCSSNSHQFVLSR